MIKAGNDNREYRTEHNTFSRIIAYGTEEAPSRFVVYSKAGLVYEYEPLTQSTKNLFGRWSKLQTHVATITPYLITNMVTTKLCLLIFSIQETVVLALHLPTP